MSVRASRRAAWSLWGFTMALFAADVVLGVVNHSLGDDTFFVILGFCMVIGYATMGAVLAARNPGNAIGWLFSTIALGLVVGIFTEEYTTFGVLTRPGRFPGVSTAAWVGKWVWILALVTIPLILLLFPTGRWPSRRWRFLPWVIVGAAAWAAVAITLDPRPLQPAEGIRLHNPTGVQALRGAIGPLIAVGGITVILAAFASVVALVLRFRRSQGEERQQIRWLAYVGAGAAAMFVGAFATGIGLGPLESSLANDLFFLGFVAMLGVGIPLAAGIAILKYRLYDLDIVIKKTVVFGALVAFGTVVYVAVVVGIGTAVGGAGNPAVTFAGAAIVAIAFQPVRNRARHLANRLVYGGRASPYEVLAEFSDRMAGTYSTEDVLPRMAQLITGGTGATRAEVWLRVGSQLRRVAGWAGNGDAPDAADRAALSGDELPALPGVDEAISVRHQGELLGALAVAMPPREPLTPPQRTLLQDLAAQAGLVLRNVGLTADLRARLEELRASRQRIVAAQDEERRRIERDIHDGAQQQMVSIAVKLRLLEGLIDRDPERAAALARQVGSEAADALEDLRDLARGIYPPLLADQGLRAAIAAQARKSAVEVEVDADGVGRYRQEVEAAVYFCVLEALQNVAKYAGSPARVMLRQEEGTLLFEVSDTGAGFDPGATPRGSGLTNMADRLAALGGELSLASSPGHGTVVTGRVPAAAAAGAAPPRSAEPVPR